MNNTDVYMALRDMLEEDLQQLGVNCKIEPMGNSSDESYKIRIVDPNSSHLSQSIYIEGDHIYCFRWKEAKISLYTPYEEALKHIAQWHRKDWSENHRVS